MTFWKSLRWALAAVFALVLLLGWIIADRGVTVAGATDGHARHAPTFVR